MINAQPERLPAELRPRAGSSGGNASHADGRKTILKKIGCVEKPVPSPLANGRETRLKKPEPNSGHAKAEEKMKKQRQGYHPKRVTFVGSRELGKNAHRHVAVTRRLETMNANPWIAEKGIVNLT